MWSRRSLIGATVIGACLGAAGTGGRPISR